MDELVKNGCVFELGGGKDGLMYPASGTSPALVLDGSGNGSNGVNSGAVLVADHLGNSDGALLIDASGEYIDCGDINLSSFYGASGKGTISIRFKYVAEARIRVLLSKYSSGATEFYIRFDEYNRLGVFFNGNVQMYAVLPSSNFLGNNWYHLSIVYDNTQTGNNKLKLYLNNSFISETVTNAATFTGLVNSTVNFIIGNLTSYFTTHYYNEAICDVAIHNRPILSGEVTTLYNGGTVTDGLVLDLPMNRLNSRTNSGIDTAGNNVITNNGAPLTVDHNGRANRGFLIDAASKYINGGDVNFRNMYGANGKGTFDIGFKYVAEARTRRLLSKYNSGRELDFYINNDNTIYAVFWDNSNAGYIYRRASNTLVNNEWYFLTVVYDNTLSGNDKIKIYLNSNIATMDSIVASGTYVELRNTSEPLIIGNILTALTTRHYNSAIDLVKIYDTETMIAKNYNHWSSH